MSAPAEVLAQLGELYATLSRSSGAMDDVDDAERILAAFNEAMAGVKALAEREAARVAGLKNRRISDELRAAEFEQVAKKWRYVTACSDTVERTGSTGRNKEWVHSRGSERTQNQVVALLAKAFPKIPERRLRSYATELQRARRKEQEARREAVRARIAMTTAQHKARIEADRARAIASSGEAVRNYLAEREFEGPKNAQAPSALERP
jgi:hypothetical protein